MKKPERECRIKKRRNQKENVGLRKEETKKGMYICCCNVLDRLYTVCIPDWTLRLKAYTVYVVLARILQLLEWGGLRTCLASMNIFESNYPILRVCFDN